jgi:hypothetical protein
MILEFLQGRKNTEVHNQPNIHVKKQVQLHAHPQHLLGCQPPLTLHLPLVIAISTATNMYEGDEQTNTFQHFGSGSGDFTAPTRLFQVLEGHHQYEYSSLE